MCVSSLGVERPWLEKKFELQNSFRNACIILCAILLASIGTAAQPQEKNGPPAPPPLGPVQIQPLVTDKSPLTLPGFFGDVGSFDINQAGDFTFRAGQSSALFLRRVTEAQPMRIFQMSDSIPGIPNSRADLMLTPFVNASRQVFFGVDFSHAGALKRALFLRTASGELQVIAHSTQTAPGSGGQPFGRLLTLIGLNDSGTAAFLAPLIPVGVSLPAQNTLYIVPAGGAPLRIVGQGDPAPGTAGSLDQITGLQFNNRGEILFRAAIVGGSGGVGLFVGSVSGVRKVVAHGDPTPLGGFFSFPASVPAAFFNHAGQVTFSANLAIWLDTPLVGLVPVVVSGAPAPPPLAGGILSGTPVVQALNDAGELAFLSSVAGSPVSNQALFRFRPSLGLEVVAYRNQPWPGLPGQVLSGFFTPQSMNSGGTIGFFVQSNFAVRGLFLQSPGGPLTLLAQDGQSTPLAGGGTLSLLKSTTTRTINAGSVLFQADVIGGVAFAGTFLASPSGLSALSSTEDPLPAGAKTSLRTFRVGAGGDFVAFLASRTGGQTTLWLHNKDTIANLRLVGEGDVAPGTAGGRITNPSPNSPFVNASGETAFSGRIVGGTANGGNAIYLANATGALSKIAAQGDIDSATGRSFSGLTLSSISPHALNDAGQVVFTATLLGALPTLAGIFVGSSSAPPVKVVLTGEPAPSGGAFLNFVGRPSINQVGQVAFVARTLNLGVQNMGIFIGSPGGVVQKIVAGGDASPVGAVFLGQFANAVPLNNNGDVAFIAALAGGPGGGVFVGSAAAPPWAVASNGDLAPSGDTFSFTTPRVDVLINNQQDVAFRADLFGGSSDSGYFLYRGSTGYIEKVVAQGDVAPDTGGNFLTFSLSLNNLVGENFALASNGEVLFSGSFTGPIFGMFRYLQNGTLMKIVVRGSLAPGTGGGSVSVFTQVEGPLTDGRYAFWAGIVGGNRTDAIYITK